jgi:HlyD family secretion protein
MTMRRSVGIAVLAVAGLAVIGGSAWWLRSGSEKAGSFRTVAVKRGDLEASISATGTVEPQEVVDVGAQVAGMIKSFGTDRNGKTVDYGSVVEAGTVLAKIDDSLYAAAVETARAQLQQAEANKLSAGANVLQMQAKLLQAGQDWERAQRLGPSDALAKSSYDQFRANYEIARANVAAAEAAVEQAKAALAQARANLSSALSNLGYTTIKSPVRGVIVDRRVNIGQTVVASLSAPSLFLIAKDLRRVKVWVSVNEADIGSMYRGQPVTFTVDAYPGRVFQGQVGKIRLNAMMTQNVVTYTVEVDTDNDDGKLLPYLTANARFVTGRRHNVLLVPNAALRWTPQPGQIAPQARQMHPGPGGTAEAHGSVWVEEGGHVRPLGVKTGLTDGAWTEVEGKELAEGLQVVIGESEREASAGPATERSPLMPQPRPQPRKPQGGPAGAGGGR